MMKCYCNISTELYMTMKKEIDKQQKELITLKQTIERLEYLNKLLYEDNQRLSTIVDKLL